MRISIILFLSLISIAGQAQKGKPETYGKTITAADLRKHLYIIAGPEMEGRETATAGQRKAAAYIEGEMKRIGLQPGNNGDYQFPFKVYADTLLDARLEVNGQAFLLNHDFGISGYNATMGFNEVVFISPKTNIDSIKNSSLSGKLVLVLPGPSGGAVYQQLQNKGVGALLWVYPPEVVAKFGSRESQSLYRFTSRLRLQTFVISPAVAQSILKVHPDSATQVTGIRKYKADVLLDVKKEPKTGLLQSSNVIGLVEGSDLKDQYLFVTAHYDHLGKQGDTTIYYGADDDGSGTVSVLKMAEAFVKAKKAGNGPRRTVVFMTVSGEEKGLWGSEYYGDHPLYPMEKTTANLNIDMVGRTDSSRKADTLNYVYVVGDDKISSELKPISEAVNQKYTKLKLDYKFNDPKDPEGIYFRSDHYNFARRGVPIIFYYDGMLGADYHKPTDTPNKINYDLMAKRAQLVFYTAWEMANSQNMLKRDKPLPEQVD